MLNPSSRCWRRILSNSSTLDNSFSLVPTVWQPRSVGLVLGGGAISGHHSGPYWGQIRLSFPTRSASSGPGAGPGHTGPCRSGTSLQCAKQNAPMNGEQVGQTPILGREGLLRLVEVVDQLRARARGEEGGSWTTGEDPGPTVGDQAVLGGAAGGQPPGGGAVAGDPGQPGGGGAAAGRGHGRRRRRGAGR